MEQTVAGLLASAVDGRIRSTKETQSVDFKEEAGRRSGRGEIDPGLSKNPAAAVALGDEVACMANSPGGGALVYGVEDGTGEIIGTELDVDWLRDTIFAKVGVAPDIQIETVEGHRLLAVYVAEAREPVEDTGGRIRWRVGDACSPVDRSEWWEHRERASHADPMAAPSHRTMDDVRAGAMEVIRSYPGTGDGTDEELLRRLGALRSDGALTQAGALLVAPMDRIIIEFTEFDVPGGSVTNRAAPRAETSLLEQLAETERVVAAVNTSITIERGIRHEALRRIPELSVREALLNGVVHRDWNRSEPTEVRWFEADSMLVVSSPGGFPGEVTASNILSNREARYPALADLFRALGLVDKQGVGVDRMYREMITIGHRPPEIVEAAGTRVECTLVGGRPVYPVMECVRAITPAERQKDYRIAIILYELMHASFVTTARVQQALQSSAEAARVAIEAARQSTVESEALIVKHKKAWLLGGSARRRLASAYDGDSAFPIVSYLTTDIGNQSAAALDWVDTFSAITTGDLQALTGTARGTAKRTLDALVDDDQLATAGSGRSSRYERP
nr:DUF5635 domain-containing protein [Gordonia humi]